MNNDSLGDRIKKYEDSYRIYLPRRSYLIIRLDQKAGSYYTRNLNKPFDDNYIEDISTSALELCKQIQGAKFAFCQSDEVNIIVTDFDDIKTEAWFGNNLQKIVSVSASILTSNFNKLRIERYFKKVGVLPDISEYGNFDSRAFILADRWEVLNTLLWRQQDWTRNSIQMLARSVASHKELLNLNTNQLQELIYNKIGFNWNDLPIYKKRGICIYKKKSDHPISMVALDKVHATVEEQQEFYKTMGADKSGCIYKYDWFLDKECPIFNQDWKWFDDKIPHLNK